MNKCWLVGHAWKYHAFRHIHLTHAGETTAVRTERYGTCKRCGEAVTTHVKGAWQPSAENRRREIKR